MRVKMIHIPPASPESAEQKIPHCLPTDGKHPFQTSITGPATVPPVFI